MVNCKFVLASLTWWAHVTYCTGEMFSHDIESLVFNSNSIPVKERFQRKKFKNISTKKQPIQHIARPGGRVVYYYSHSDVVFGHLSACFSMISLLVFGHFNYYSGTLVVMVNLSSSGMTTSL